MSIEVLNSRLQRGADRRSDKQGRRERDIVLVASSAVAEGGGVVDSKKRPPLCLETLPPESLAFLHMAGRSVVLLAVGTIQ